MTEFNDINLPADFDDLSKHAPLLEKLRGKGDGFVVPEGYFSEVSELSVANCQLSVVSGQDAGFVIPENYFEELAERIIAIVSLSNVDNRQLTTDNSFPVPENYFEELGERINAIVSLSNADNRLLTTDNCFEVPEGYFNELDETLNTKLALDNLKQDEGFDVPDGYFEKLSGKILSRVAVDELNQGSDAEVPSGYFDTLADRISARIAEEKHIEPEKTIERGRIIVFAEVLKRYSRPISIAASVTLLISVSIWFFNHGNNGKSEPALAKINPPKQNIQPVIPPVQKKDTVIVPKEDEVAVIKTPKQKSPPDLNLQKENVVKEVEKQDIMEQLDLIDENTVADYVSDQNPEIKIVQQEEYLNDQMLKYIIDNNIDPSDINKLP